MAKKVNVLIITNKQVFPATDGGALAMKKLASMLDKKMFYYDLYI